MTRFVAKELSGIRSALRSVWLTVSVSNLLALALGVIYCRAFLGLTFEPLRASLPVLCILVLSGLLVMPLQLIVVWLLGVRLKLGASAAFWGVLASVPGASLGVALLLTARAQRVFRGFGTRMNPREFRLFVEENPERTHELKPGISDPIVAILIGLVLLFCGEIFFFSTFTVYHSIRIYGFQMLEDEEYEDAEILLKLLRYSGDPAVRARYAMALLHSSEENSQEEQDAVSRLQRDWEIEPVAALGLGIAYENAWGVEEDVTLAVKYFEHAAELGSVEGMFEAGGTLFGIPGREADGLKWMRKAADRKYPGAINRLGVIYERGDFGVEKDLGKAEALYREAFERGHSKASCFLIDLLVEHDRALEAVEFWETKTSRDEPECINLLAYCYDEGYGGMTPDPGKAHELYRRAAELGLPVGMYNYAVELLDISGREKEGLGWLRKASKAEYNSAMNLLGRAYENGDYGLEQDLHLAEEYFREAVRHEALDAPYNLSCLLFRQDRDAEAIQALEQGVEQEDPESFNFLGYCYDVGQGVEKDPEKALELFLLAAKTELPVGMSNAGIALLEFNRIEEGLAMLEKAVESKHAYAMNYLGTIYEDGKYGVTPELSRAEALYRESFELEYAKAAFNLANLLFKQGKPSDAIHFLELGSEMKELNCVSYLAYCYDVGQGVEKNPEKALELYLQTAQLGHTSGMSNTGLILLDAGRAKEGFEWLQRAGTTGFTPALYWLGHCHENGNGTEKNLVTALEYYRKAAEKEEAQAYYALGRFYQEGIAMEANPSEALKFFEKAKAAWVLKEDIDQRIQTLKEQLNTQ